LAEPVEVNEKADFIVIPVISGVFVSSRLPKLLPDVPIPLGLFERETQTIRYGRKLQDFEGEASVNRFRV
jgi:hypothetical protein